MAITLNDIAKRSGFSISTVSRVLNKKSRKYRISTEVEQIVLKAAAELNYRPNQLARGLRLKKTLTIGLVAPDISNPFFASIIKTIQTEAHKMGYSLVVCDSDEGLELEIEHVSLLSGKGVDGLIVLPVGQEFAHFQELINDGIPVVMLDRGFDGLAASKVVIDNRGGAFEAVEHLIGHGHSRIAIVQGLPDTYTSRGRLQGYFEALAAHGIPADHSLVVGKDFRKENGYIETKFLLESAHPPTAMFTTSDLITLGALEAISEEGLELPADLSLVAFDDLDAAEFFRCPITAVAQPKETMGEMAVKLLTDQMRNPETSEIRTIMLKPTLVVRSSVAGPPRLKPVNAATV